MDQNYRPSNNDTLDLSVRNSDISPDLDSFNFRADFLVGSVFGTDADVRNCHHPFLPAKIQK